MSSIRITPLDLSLCSALKARAAVVLNGVDNGRCSLRAMSMSCFASEYCSHNAYSTMKLDMLMTHPHRFVAMDGEEFVGCVSAVPRKDCNMFDAYCPGCYPDPECLVLFNLCVSHEYRGQGVGPMLVNEIVKISQPVYLLVSKLDVNETDVRRRQIYDDRVSGLMKFYGKLGFEVQQEFPKCFLLGQR